MNIYLRIERLVIDGVPMTPRQTHLLRASAEAQLAAMLYAAPPHTTLSYAVPTLSAAPITLSADRNPVAAGRDLARSLHSALAPGVTSNRSHPGHSATAITTPTDRHVRR